MQATEKLGVGASASSAVNFAKLKKGALSRALSEGV